MQLYRTMLFIPAQKDRWIAKAAGLGADSIILDLEDALPDDLKAPTRARIGAAIDAVADAGVPCFVRTNAMATGMLFEDLDAVATPALTGIVLAKVNTPEEVRIIDTFLSDLERRRGIPDRRIELVITAETANCIEHAYDICAASPRVGTIMGGTARGGDINRAIGYVWTREGIESLYLRSRIVVGARAAGIQYPISGIWTDIEDLDGLRAHALRNRQLGYRGEFVIHPSHVPIVNEVYTPSKDDIEYSRGVLEAMAAAERAGSAGVRFRGELIDYAHVRSARDTLALVDRYRAVPPPERRRL
jgi:citrate lyase subunit beta/citryl-CoA lyase